MKPRRANAKDAQCSNLRHEKKKYVSLKFHVPCNIQSELLLNEFFVFDDQSVKNVISFLLFYIWIAYLIGWVDLHISEPHERVWKRP